MRKTKLKLMLESEIYDWLNKYKIQTPQYKIFDINDVPELDFYPVALKIMSRKVVHKSDVGAVALNINDKEALINAKSVIKQNLVNKNIVLTSDDKFIATEMCSGIELFFGIIDDAIFGRVIVFGAGGVLTEVFKDVCFIDSEAGDEEIERAIYQTRISELFTDVFRGKRHNIQLAIDLIKKLQQLEVQEMDLNPVLLTEESLTVVDARLLKGKKLLQDRQIKFLPELFSPENIAIIGVSKHRHKIGYALAKNTAGDENVYYVNPHLKLLFDKKVYQTIEELPLIDTAIIAIPPGGIKDTIRQLIQKKVKNVIIITAGFKEAGRDENFLKEFVDENEINIVGPNCIGIYTNKLNLTFGTNQITKGATNLFSQSGAVVAEMMDKAAQKQIGFENIVSVGNMVDVDFADLINSYTGKNTVNLYIEGISNGKNLLRVVRKSAARIRIFKAGQSEVARRAAFSHTGNMAGNYEMFVGLLKAAGAQMLSDINGLLYSYDFKNILLITNAGGAGTVMCDAIPGKLYNLNQTEMDKLSEVLPPHWSKNNPVDIIGDATGERYLKAMIIADDFNIDAMFVLVTPQFMTNPEAISTLFVKHKFKTPVFPVLLGGEMMEPAKTYLHKHRIIFFEEISEAVSFLK